METNQNQPTQPVHITITLPTNAYFMSGIRDFTLSLIKNMTQFSQQWAYRFQSVVDELCNNAIEHGSVKGNDIKVEFIQYPDAIEIIVDDTGTGEHKMTPADMQSLVAERTKPDFPFTGIRGRGLAKIVHGWTDELEFSVSQLGGLRTRIKKYLKPETPTEKVALNDPTHVTLNI